MADQGLVRETACAVVDKLRTGEVTPLDLLDVLEKRIAEVDGKVNALPTLCFDRARDRARALMKKPASERGLLAGLPVPIKDLTDVAGVLTTQGSPIYRDNVPARSDVLVEHLEANGAIVYAKSNTPEFGAGANTFNEVFGRTLNPWDTSRSAAGSSGGAAAALATGTAWLAHGSDMGGSLRNPASFCGIVGMRPSIGRVAHTPAAAIDRNLGVQGPMARNVEDLALLLDAMSGEDPADPLSLALCCRIVPVGGAIRQQADLCPADPFEDATDIRCSEDRRAGWYRAGRVWTYGYASGIVGLPSPEPGFRRQAARDWDPERYYTHRSTSIRTSPAAVPAWACPAASAMSGRAPLHPPADPAHPLGRSQLHRRGAGPVGGPAVHLRRAGRQFLLPAGPHLSPGPWILH